MTTAMRVKEWVIASLIADSGYPVRSADSVETRFPCLAVRVAIDNRDEAFMDSVEVRVEAFTDQGEAVCYAMVSAVHASLLRHPSQWTVSPQSKQLRMMHFDRITTTPPARDGDPPNGYASVMVFSARGKSI